jgi:hypothetical protein
MHSSIVQLLVTHIQNNRSILHLTMLNNNIRKEELLMYDSIKIPIHPYIEVENLQLYILKAEKVNKFQRHICI